MNPAVPALVVAAAVLALLLSGVLQVNINGGQTRDASAAPQTNSAQPSNAGANSGGGNLDITAAELQRAVGTSSQFAGLKSSDIMITFFDGNGVPRINMAFVIGPGGTVTEASVLSGHDVELSTGDYYIQQIKQTSDVCALLKTIQKNKDFRVKLNMDIFSAGSKYGSLSSCIPFY